MHGRVKVLRTSEQEKLRKEKKLKLNEEFSALCDKLWCWRASGKYGEDQLSALATALEISPETNTFWNYRREIIKHLLESFSGDRTKSLVLLKGELDLTARCLVASPKSYPTWHHRVWVMKNHIDPDWRSEINFCNQALKCDERNFHCWDYRRFVVSAGSIKSESELKYASLALEDNFSNFSAWHYRGELLESSANVMGISSPLSPPPQVTNGTRFDFTLPCDELDLVHNAIYTDPVDQSPWFFLWWLLGRGERKVYMRDLYISRSLGRLILTFSAVKSSLTLRQLDVSIKVFPPDGSVKDAIVLTPDMLGGWNSALEEGLSAVWWLPLDHDVVCCYAPESQKHLYLSGQWNVSASVCVRQVEGCDEPKTFKNPDCPDDHLFCLQCTMDYNQNESLTRVALDPLRLLNPLVLPTHDPDTLLSELNVIRDLVNIEPENKWALLTFVGLLRFVRPPGYDEEVNSSLAKLTVLDSQRSAYYEDLKSSYAAQDAIVLAYADQCREISLRNLKMNYLHHLDWYTLMTKIDFSNNSLTTIPDTFAYLICLLELCLDDNKLITLQGISRLPSLSHLSVQRNKLCEFKSIQDLLHCQNLRIVYINGNKVAELNDLTRLLSEHPGVKRQGHSFSVVYDKSIRS